jgi:hypothetical protein
MNAAEPIDGSTATPAELRRAGIEALVRDLGPVGMARVLQQFDRATAITRPTAPILGTPTVDNLMDKLEHRRQSPPGEESLAAMVEPCRWAAY